MSTPARSLSLRSGLSCVAVCVLSSWLGLAEAAQIFIPAGTGPGLSTDSWAVGNSTGNAWFSMAIPDDLVGDVPTSVTLVAFGAPGSDCTADYDLTLSLSSAGLPHDETTAMMGVLADASPGVLVEVDAMALFDGLTVLPGDYIEPGIIRTAMSMAMPDDLRERAISESLLRRMGEPIDIASMVAFLCGPGGRHITGQIMRVDGGEYL